jgi:hypothetical protein
MRKCFFCGDEIKQDERYVIAMTMNLDESNKHVHSQCFYAQGHYTQPLFDKDEPHEMD